MGPNDNGAYDDRLEETLSSRREDISEAIAQAREEMDVYLDRAAAFIRERPVVAVAAALAMGWFIGRLVSRR